MIEEVNISLVEKGDLAYLAEAAVRAGRERVRAQVRIKHLAKLGRTSPITEIVFEAAKRLETVVDKQLAECCTGHCTWEWAKRANGAGLETYPKVVGLIEAFGRYYEVGHPMIPAYVKRSPVEYLKMEKGKTVKRIGVWVEGIERLANISKLRKYAGYSVDAETGEIQKKKKGHKLSYNANLRTALWVLGGSLTKQKGIWYFGRKEEGYSLGYKGWKDERIEKCRREGLKIVPTPKIRVCPECGEEVTAKATHFCPVCGMGLIGKIEPPGYYYEGHLHMDALRMMNRDFVTCVWIVWRTALELPVPGPYIEKNHKPYILDPWKMVDK